MSCREELHRAVYKLAEKRVESVKNNVDALLERSHDESLHDLLRIPGIRLGRDRDPNYHRLEPIKVEGELASEQIIRER